MLFFVNIGEASTGAWQPASEISPSADREQDPDTLKWVERILLPSGEELEVTVSYQTNNRATSFWVMAGKRNLVNVLAHKSKESNYDPVVVLTSPLGIPVQLMVSLKRQPRPRVAPN